MGPKDNLVLVQLQLLRAKAKGLLEVEALQRICWSCLISLNFKKVLK